MHPGTAKRRPRWKMLEVIDLESYRNEAREAVVVKHAGEEAEVWAVPTGSIGTIVSPEMDPPPTFLNDFNGISGNINGEGR